MRSARLTLPVALALVGVACRSGPAPAIDPALTDRIPPGTVILAGVNLDRVRASPWASQLPAAARAVLDPLRDANYLLFASTGTDYLLLARGNFSSAPAGMTLLIRGLAAAGSPVLLQGAKEHPRGSTGRTPALLAPAEEIAATSAIWAAVAGSASLPLSGNAENINNLLHNTRYSTIAIRLDGNAEIEVVGICGAPETAQHLEETLRALAGIGAAATARQPAVAALLKRIQISRQATSVRLFLSADAGDLEQIWKFF